MAPRIIRHLLYPCDLGHVRDYDETKALMKVGLKEGKGYIIASYEEIAKARRILNDPVEWENMFGDLDHQCHE